MILLVTMNIFILVCGVETDLDEYKDKKRRENEALVLARRDS